MDVEAEPDTGKMRAKTGQEHICPPAVLTIEDRNKKMRNQLADAGSFNRMNGGIKSRPVTIQISIWATTNFEVIPNKRRTAARQRAPARLRCGLRCGRRFPAPGA